MVLRKVSLLTLAAVATNQLGSSPPVACEEKFPWLLSQSGNASSAVNMEGDGVLEYTQSMMKTWTRSNVGNQNNNSLFFTIIVESKEKHRKVGKSKELQKAKMVITTKNLQCPMKILCLSSVIGGGCSVRACQACFYISSCALPSSGTMAMACSIKTLVFLWHLHEALKVYRLKPGCSCSICVIGDWVLQFALSAVQVWEVAIFSFCFVNATIHSNRPNILKYLDSQLPSRSFSSEITFLLKVIKDLLLGLETNSKPNTTLAPGQRVEKSRWKKRSKRKLPLAPVGTQWWIMSLESF